MRILDAPFSSAVKHLSCKSEIESWFIGFKKLIVCKVMTTPFKVSVLSDFFHFTKKAGSRQSKGFIEMAKTKIQFEVEAYELSVIGGYQ